MNPHDRSESSSINPNEFKQRIRKRLLVVSYFDSYLTLLTIIQSVALSLLTGAVIEQRANLTTLDYMVVAANFFAVIAIWRNMKEVFSFFFTPQLLDFVILLLICVVEAWIIYHTRQSIHWAGGVALLGCMNALAFWNIFRRAAKYPEENTQVLKTLCTHSHRTIMFSLGVALIFAFCCIYLVLIPLSLSGKWLTAILAVFIFLFYLIARGKWYWKNIQQTNNSLSLTRNKNKSLKNLYRILQLFLVKSVAKWGSELFQKENGHTPAEWAKSIFKIISLHATVNGIFAGFSISFIAFIGTNMTEKPDNDLPVMMSHFIIATVGFMGAAVAYSVNFQVEKPITFLLYSVASSLYWLSAIFAFTGLLHFTNNKFPNTILPTVAGIATFGGAFLGGFLASSIPYNHLLGIRKSLILIIFIFCFILTYLFFNLSKKIDYIIDFYLITQILSIILLFGTVQVIVFFEFKHLSDKIQRLIGRLYLFFCYLVAWIEFMIFIRHYMW